MKVDVTSISFIIGEEYYHLHLYDDRLTVYIDEPSGTHEIDVRDNEKLTDKADCITAVMTVNALLKSKVGFVVDSGIKLYNNFVLKV